jgi:hypothetical protein
MYVCDRAYEEFLLVSVASWSRFRPCALAVVDLGMTDSGKEAIRRLVPSVKYLTPVGGDTDGDLSARRRAFRQKARVGLSNPFGRVVFLDADIVVVARSFFRIFSLIRPRSVLAAASAWDRDFTWTYNEQSLPLLRALTATRDLELSWPIPNSGVWAADSVSAALACQEWSTMMGRVYACGTLASAVNANTAVGDQEFMMLAARAAGVEWRRLHGSYNMQVHDSRMRWRGRDGGHFGERLQEVKAVHFAGCPEGDPEITTEMLGVPDSREFVLTAYQEVREWLRERQAREA